MFPRSLRIAEELHQASRGPVRLKGNGPFHPRFVEACSCRCRGTIVSASLSRGTRQLAPPAIFLVPPSRHVVQRRGASHGAAEGALPTVQPKGASHCAAEGPFPLCSRRALPTAQRRGRFPLCSRRALPTVQPKGASHVAAEGRFPRRSGGALCRGVAARASHGAAHAAHPYSSFSTVIGSPRTRLPVA